LDIISIIIVSTLTAKLLEQLNEEYSIVQRVYKLPWPLNKREVIVLSKSHYNPNTTQDTPSEEATHICEVTIPYHPDAPYDKKKIVRCISGQLFQHSINNIIIESVNIFRPLGESKCKSVSIIYSNLKIPRIPKSILNALTKSSLPKEYVIIQQLARLLNAGFKPTYEQIKKYSGDKSSSSTHSDRDDDSSHSSEH
jgi:hypothetical protein